MTNIKLPPTLWIDADACPKVIKEVVFKFAERLKLKTILVANSQMQIPLSPLISLVVVKQGADIADQYIAQNAEELDIVITQDIPLASLIVAKKAYAINVRGELYTEDNISERLSMRDFMHELRQSTGSEIGGPAAFNAKDKENFTNTLNRLLVQRLKN